MHHKRENGSILSNMNKSRFKIQKFHYFRCFKILSEKIMFKENSKNRNIDVKIKQRRKSLLFLERICNPNLKMLQNKRKNTDQVRVY